MSAADSLHCLHDDARTALTERLRDWGFSGYHADQLWSVLYRQRAADWAALGDLRSDLLDRLRRETTLFQPRTALAITSKDGHTQKYLLEMADGERVESVLMRYRDRLTACISTQVGCAMGCVFCATGQMGFRRHLSPGEIVGQVLHLQRDLGPARQGRLRNVVFMGMGEPLHNYEATMTAVAILTDPKGLAFAPRHVTLSTVGIPAAIRRLADEGRAIQLAVSLHAASDAERAALVPPARRWPLDDLLDACCYYIERLGRRVFFEWALIAGQNDSPDHARRVGRLLRGLNAHLNVIPLNPTTGYAGLPSGREDIRQFQAIVAEYGVPSTVRQRRGLDIGAGCGQLRVQDDDRRTKVMESRADA